MPSLTWRGTFDATSVRVNGKLCVPSAMESSADIAEAAHLWFTNHPDWTHEPAALGMGVMLIGTFACKK